MVDRKLFYEDPDLDRLETTVVATGEIDGRPFVRLEETIFYPEGGGQPADRGTIAGVPVVDVQGRGDEVLHLLAAPVGPGRVACALDTARRFDHRQQHTAQHLVTAVLQDRHELPTTSFHLGDAYTAIEVAGAPPAPRTLRTFEDEINAEIRRNRRVATHWVAPDELAALTVRTRGLPDGHSGLVRLVEIEGIDLNTCGGTHVASLGELQAVHILDASAARGGTRIRFLAGGRVLAELRRRGEVEESLKSRIGAGPEEFAAVIDGWHAERKRLGRRVRDLEREVAAAEASALARDPRRVLRRVLPGAAPELLRAVAAATLAERPEAVVVLAGSSGDPSEACFLVQAGPAGPEDVAPLGARVRDALGAKGGGRGRLHQGRGGRLPADPGFLDALEVP